MEASDMQKMREALESICDISALDLSELEVLGKRLQDTSTYGGGLVLKLVHGVRNGQKALAEPPRNCDLYGGDYKMLHTKWSEWTASPSGRNPNNTMKMTFSEWLLAPANEKGATDGRQ